MIISWANMGRKTAAQAAAALIAAMTTPPTAPRRALITAAINALFAAGVWTRLDFLHVYAAADSQAASLNWLNPAAFTASEVAAPTFTADRGYNGDGVASYVNTNYNPGTQAINYTQDSASIAMWCLTAAANTNYAGGWYSGGLAGVAISPRLTGDLCTIKVNQVSPASQFTNLDGTGFYFANRSGSNATQASINGVAQVVTINSNRPSVAITSAPLTWNRPTTAVFSIQQGALLAAGGGMSATQQTAFYNAMLPYMQGVGAA